MSRSGLLALGLALVLGAVAGYLVADRTVDPETTTVTAIRTETRRETQTVTVEPTGLTEPVQAKRAAIHQAAAAQDFETLAALAASDFTYTFGGPVEGGPAEYWRQAQQRGERPLEALMAILELPYTLSRGIYVWPFAYEKTAEEITAHEAGLLERIPGRPRVGPEGYLGWRAGIRPDGSWIYFVAGD